MVAKQDTSLARRDEGMAGNSAKVSPSPPNTIPVLKLLKYLSENCPTLRTTATTPPPALFTPSPAQIEAYFHDFDTSHHDFEELQHGMCSPSYNNPQNTLSSRSLAQTETQSLGLHTLHHNFEESRHAACPSFCNNCETTCRYLGHPTAISGTPLLVQQSVTPPLPHIFDVLYLLCDTSQYHSHSFTPGSSEAHRYFSGEPQALTHNIPPLGKLNEIGENCTSCMASDFQASQTPICHSPTNCSFPTF